MKRILALMLALMLCLGMAGTALAAEIPDSLPKKAMPVALPDQADLDPIAFFTTLLSGSLPNLSGLMETLDFSEDELAVLLRAFLTLGTAAPALESEGAEAASAAFPYVESVLTELTPLVAKHADALSKTIWELAAGMVDGFAKLDPATDGLTRLCDAYTAADTAFGQYRDWASVLTADDVKTLQTRLTEALALVDAPLLQSALADLLRMLGEMPDLTGLSSDLSGPIGIWGGSEGDPLPDATIIGGSDGATDVQVGTLPAWVVGSSQILMAGPYLNELTALFLGNLLTPELPAPLNLEAYIADHPPVLYIDVEDGLVIERLWLRDGVFYAPVRISSEYLGYTVVWNQSDQSVTFTNGSGGSFQMMLGLASAQVNGQEVILPSAPVLRDGLTYLDLTVLAELWSLVSETSFAIHYAPLDDTVYLTASASEYVGGTP